MPKGDLPKEIKDLQEQMETVLALLYRCVDDVDEITLRVRQANKRTCLVHDVLYPGIDRLTVLHDRLQHVHTHLGKYWSAMQARRWGA